MDPLLLSSLMGAGVQAGSGILGYILSAPDQERANQLINAAVDEFGQLDVPKLEQMVAEEVGPSAYEQLRTDPRLKSAQYAALDRLERSATEGLTLDDKAAQNEALKAAARQESAGRQRIAEDFQARGQLGSGAQLAMQLQNQQGAAERGNDISMRTAANAQRRMFDAMMQSGKMASELRGQDFDEQSRIAQARDAVARYNAGARQSARAQNINNQQWLYNAQRQGAADKLTAGRIKAGVAQGQADQLQGLFGGVGTTGAQALNLYGQSQQPKRKNPYDYGGGYQLDPEEWV